MARMTITGLEGFTDKLLRMGNEAELPMTAAVFAGAGKLVEAVAAEIDMLPEQQGYMRPGDQRNVVTRDEKEALKTHIGIAKFEKTGGQVTTAIGFGGYSEHKTKKYPNGVPIPLIARSVESGSSVRQKHPFMRNAVNKAKAAVEQAMREAAEAKFREMGR